MRIHPLGFLERIFSSEIPLLLVGSFVLVLGFILLNVFHVFPLTLVDFIFFSSILFLAALYRPNWTFLLFISLLALENINIAPLELMLGLRPYQWWGMLLALAVLVRVITRRTPWPLFRFSFLDLLLLLLPFGALLSSGVTGAPGSMKFAFILGSYSVLYFLGRIFFHKKEDAEKVFPFLLVGAVLALLTGLSQNILFMRGYAEFSVMPGRPNGTFPEADWFGLFLLLVLSALLVALSVTRRKLREAEELFSWRFFGLLLLLLLNTVVLILTVSRSAWLGAIFVVLAFLVAMTTEKAGSTWRFHWKEGLFFGNFLFVVFVLALLMVQDLNLTRFELFNRVASTASGLQRITIACEEERALPDKIATLSELDPLGCRFINLEEIEAEKANGNFITTIFRPDPNVEIRKNIYLSIKETVLAHPIFGIGWGAIGDILGRDARGAALNASNVFFEIWLGSGLLGLVGFVFWFGFGALKSVTATFTGETSGLSLFFFLFLGGMGIFNLFNSGLLLGFLWIYFSLLPIISSYAKHRH